ncbi:hypothetical protein DPMN_114130 [Dreissena polymorpha]|uniref:Uncharacterized protein n=1 Tax=Dreissena polymorpha TaxID=45954 RepID=A0A9D4QRA2_DREPO|nr:hypothetical protein DPMN_114130 [Dreissena polymorpha]
MTGAAEMAATEDERGGHWIEMTLWKCSRTAVLSAFNRPGKRGGLELYELKDVSKFTKDHSLGV